MHWLYFIHSAAKHTFSANPLSWSLLQPNNAGLESLTTSSGPAAVYIATYTCLTYNTEQFLHQYFNTIT